MKAVVLFTAALLLGPALLWGAEAPQAVPKNLPAASATALQKERAALLKDQASLKSKIQRHKAKCQKENPAMKHVCHTERQSLLSAGEALDRKVLDFNKRVKEQAKPPVTEAAAPAP